MVTEKKAARGNPQPVPMPMQSRTTTMPREAEARLNRACQEAERLSHKLQRLRRESDELGKRIAHELEASRHEIERLARCVEELVQSMTQAAPPRTPAQAPSWPQKSLFTFLGRPSFPSVQ